MEDHGQPAPDDCEHECQLPEDEDFGMDEDEGFC